MTPAEQLSALPEPVQAEVWAAPRLIIGLSSEEKLRSLDALVGMCAALTTFGDDSDRAAAEAFIAFGQAIRAVDAAAFPRETEVA